MIATADSTQIVGVTKICIKCGIEKHLSEFAKNRSMKSGLLNACKVCLNAARATSSYKSSIKKKASRAAWRAANPEKARASRDAWQAKNRAKVNADNAAWRAANHDRVVAHRVAWEEANAEKIKARRAERLALHPELRRIHEHNRRAREVKAGGKLSPGLAAKLFKLQGGKCACCKLPLGDDYHLDHVMPLRLGGSNTDDNIQLLRKRCNLQKNAMHPVDFMRQRGFLI